MFEGNVDMCKRVLDAKNLNSGSVNTFLNTVLHNKNVLKNNNEQEILATADNPYTKAQEETGQISQELEDIKRKKFLEMKRRKQLYSNSQDLRLLESQIRAAWISKELIDQKKATASYKEEALQKQRELDEQWKNECSRALEIIKKEEQIERDKKAQLMAVLKAQMKENSKRRLLEHEQVMEDRAEMMKRLQRLKMEDMAEQEKRQRIRQTRKEEMEECVREKARRKLLEKQQKSDDFEEQMAHLKHRDELDAKIIRERKKLLAEREALSERLGNQLEKLQNEQQERDNLLLSLLIEERKANEDARYRRNIEKQLEEHKKLLYGLDMYMNEIKRDKEARALEEERQFNEERKRFLEDYDMMTQKSLEERKRKLVENSRIVQAIIEERRRHKTYEAAEKIKEHEMLLTMQRERDQQIEEERLKLLQSQPPEILRYLPIGTLRPSDREHLNLSYNTKA